VAALRHFSQKQQQQQQLAAVKAGRWTIVSTHTYLLQSTKQLHGGSHGCLRSS